MVMHFSLILRECNFTAMIFQTCSFRVEIYSWRTRLLKQEKPSEEKITLVNRISFLHLVTYIIGPFPRSLVGAVQFVIGRFDILKFS